MYSLCKQPKKVLDMGFSDNTRFMERYEYIWKASYLFKKTW